MDWQKLRKTMNKQIFLSAFEFLLVSIAIILWVLYFIKGFSETRSLTTGVKYQKLNWIGISSIIVVSIDLALLFVFWLLAIRNAYHLSIILPNNEGASYLIFFTVSHLWFMAIIAILILEKNHFGDLAKKKRAEIAELEHGDLMDSINNVGESHTINHTDHTVSIKPKKINFFKNKNKKKNSDDAILNQVNNVQLDKIEDNQNVAYEGSTEAKIRRLRKENNTSIFNLSEDYD